MDLAKQDWLDALDDLIESEGADRVKEILSDLQLSAYRKGIRLSFSANTPKPKSSKSKNNISSPA